MMTAETFLSDFQSIVNGIFRICILSAIALQFSVELFIVRLSTVCIHTLLFCYACLRMAWNGTNSMAIP